VKLHAYGIEIDLPRGWDGRISRRHGADPTLHAANFPLPAVDGDFGSGATARMPHGGALLVIKEYHGDDRLVPGTGLFASRSIPLPLHPGHFHPRTLQVGRPAQAGFQHFFTVAGRPFCIYAVVKTPSTAATIASGAHSQVAQLSHLASSLRFHRQS
jgi:hypothetical protein